MAQRRPPSLTSSGPLGFQFLALGPGLHQVPGTVTSEVLHTCGQLEKCRTGCESPPGYVERLQEGQGADTSCLATLIPGGILQRPFGSHAWHGSRGRRVDWISHQQWEACCPHTFLVGSLLWSYEPQCPPNPVKGGRLSPPHGMPRGSKDRAMRMLSGLGGHDQLH